MTCDLCSENEANVHLTEVINEESRELHLCDSCAQEKGLASLQSFGLPDLLGGLAELSAPGPSGAKQPKLKCESCSMTYEDFRKSGRLGCGNCYQAFQAYLAPLLKRIHGSAHHVGKTPASAAPRKGASQDPQMLLKEQLKIAIEKEAFEEAVALRDQIRKLETKSASRKAPAKKPLKRKPKVK